MEPMHLSLRLKKHPNSEALQSFQLCEELCHLTLVLSMRRDKLLAVCLKIYGLLSFHVALRSWDE